MERPVHEAEGVIKFHAEHTSTPLPADMLQKAHALSGWRKVLMDLEVFGQDPKRYDGAGFGNLSVRTNECAETESTSFVITGSQTGHLKDMPPQAWAWVSHCDLRQNRVVSKGQSLPSSESLTHGAIYRCDPAIGAVFHVHAPALWHARDALGLPTTAADIPYGTEAMADAVMALYGQKGLSTMGILAMAGHEDGIIALGAHADEAGSRLVTYLSKAYGLAVGPIIATLA